MKKIVSRGRVLGKNSSEFARMLEGSEGTKTFTLKSGRQAKFLLTVVLSGEIESRTFVDPAVNGRDQSLLTPESVSDISRTIKLQQFSSRLSVVWLGSALRYWTDHVAALRVSSMKRNLRFW